MEWVVVTVIILFVIGRFITKAQERAADARFELRRPDYELDEYTTLQVDFQTMTMKMHLCGSLGPMEADGTKWILRRSGPTHWESLEVLGGEWETLDDKLCSKIEGDYQQFLHHGGR